MFIFSALLFTLNILAMAVHAQKVPPGVPPQRYQGQPPQQQQFQQPQYQQQQQYQQPQQAQQAQYQQQVPVQQQQVPMQQQVPVNHQQVPVEQGHGHGHHHDHGRPQQVLNAANVAQEAQHIAEHMDVPIDTSKMTEQELQFHYFKMHDADNNNKLDGCELIKSLIHWHGVSDEPNILTDEEISKFVDEIINEYDKDNDGSISYVEYKIYSP